MGDAFVKLLRGAPVVGTIDAKLTQDVAACRAQNIVPTLAIVRVGDKEDDVAYETGAIKHCEKIGIAARRVTLPASAGQEELLQCLRARNAEAGVHGVLLLRPLPPGFDDELARNTLAPNKDVDGITDASLTAVFTGSGAGFAPCTPEACMEMLAHYDIQLDGKSAVVVGRSLVVGKPAAMLLLSKNATVTICHTHTPNMAEVCRAADILIVGVGRPGMIDKAYLSPGQIVLDVGINVMEDGSLRGDVDFAAAQGIVVGGVTPVPGGVGPVTTSILLRHVVESAKKCLK